MATLNQNLHRQIIIKSRESTGGGSEYKFRVTTSKLRDIDKTTKKIMLKYAASPNYHERQQAALSTVLDSDIESVLLRPFRTRNPTKGDDIGVLALLAQNPKRSERAELFLAGHKMPESIGRSLANAELLKQSTQYKLLDHPSRLVGITLANNPYISIETKLEILRRNKKEQVSKLALYNLSERELRHMLRLDVKVQSAIDIKTLRMLRTQRQTSTLIDYLN